MSSPASFDACRDQSLRSRSGLSDENNRQAPLRLTSLVKMAAVIAALSLTVSCSAISKILTETGSEDEKWEETINKGSRIPLPPSVEDFEPGKELE